jgi:hypothetical protein
MKSAPLILLIAGLVLLVVFGLVALVSMILMATSNGRIDPDEAGPFIGGGCCCSFFGLAMAVSGLVWWLVGRQQKP